MATLIGAIASSHTPTIGFALDARKQDELLKYMAMRDLEVPVIAGNYGADPAAVGHDGRWTRPRDVLARTLDHSLKVPGRAGRWAREQAGGKDGGHCRHTHSPSRGRSIIRPRNGISNCGTRALAIGSKRCRWETLDVEEIGRNGVHRPRVSDCHWRLDICQYVYCDYSR